MYNQIYNAMLDAQLSTFGELVKIQGGAKIKARVFVELENDVEAGILKRVQDAEMVLYTKYSYVQELEQTANSRHAHQQKGDRLEVRGKVFDIAEVYPNHRGGAYVFLRNGCDMPDATEVATC